jgi:phage regulator Rha-like protein
MESGRSMIPRKPIETKILLVRGCRVILDGDLAYLYGVPAKRLNEQVRRNLKRFPDDFMFQLTNEEYRVLRSQIATLKKGRGMHRKYLPYVFTEQGVAMLSSVLHSESAIQVNIAIMRAFVKLRETLSTNKELALKLKQLEMKTREHDEEIQAIFEAIRRLTERPPEVPKRHIGFQVKTR